jgi:tRNA(Ile)-lysidine synthase
MVTAPSTIAARVGEFVREHGVFLGVRCVRVGFSGGADSTALLLLLTDLGLGLEVEAVHLHHGIRGEAADADAAWCAQFCAARGIRFVTAGLSVPAVRQPGESLEEAARRLRLAYWRATTAAHVAAVALAHHHDDCLEDLLLRLARGANAGGLTAMRPVGEVCGVRLLRPLLCLRRCEIEAFLRARGVTDWRRDASNADTTMRRNAIRHEWLPLMRRTVGHDNGLACSLAALREDADCLADLAHAALAAVGSLTALQRLHPALLPRVLRLWLQAQTGCDCIVPRASVLRVRRELERGADVPRRIPIGQGRLLRLDRDGLHLVADAAPLAPRTWPWRRQPWLDLPDIGAALVAETMPAPAGPGRATAPLAEFFALESLEAELQVRPWAPGDRMVPFGWTTPAKLQDLFTAARVPREQRSRLPVLLNGASVLWVPGVRRAEFGRVHPGCQAVRLRLVRGPEACIRDGRGRVETL